MSKQIIYLISGLIVGFIFGMYIAQAFATQPEKITWCHTEPNGNQQTLELPQAALEQAGHVDANGNPLHAGDHIGACVEDEITPTPTPTVTECDQDECEPSVTPTPTEEVTPTPTEEPKGDNSGDPKNEEVRAPAPVVCTVPFEKPRVWYTKEDGKVFFNWAEDTTVDKFSIVYGYSPENLEYGVDNLPSDARSLEINGLDTTKHTYFQVQAWQNGCMEGSEVIDP